MAGSSHYGLKNEEVAILPPELAIMLEGDFDSEDEEEEYFIPNSEDSVSTSLEQSDSDDD